MPRVACATRALLPLKMRRRPRHRMIVRSCWRVPRRCVGAWRNCPIRMVCCWPICQAGASEGGASGLSQSRALAICRRMVAVHCLYGVDSNRLAVELAKLSLWLESFAEGLPLTFLDHRLVQGDSLAGPFFASLMTLPVGGKELDPLLARDVERGCTKR